MIEIMRVLLICEFLCLGLGNHIRVAILAS